MSCFRTIFTHASFVLIDSNEIGDKKKRGARHNRSDSIGRVDAPAVFVAAQHFTCLLPLFFVGDNEIHLLAYGLVSSPAGDATTNCNIEPVAMTTHLTYIWIQWFFKEKKKEEIRNDELCPGWVVTKGRNESIYGFWWWCCCWWRETAGYNQVCCKTISFALAERPVSDCCYHHSIGFRDGSQRIQSTLNMKPHHLPPFIWKMGQTEKEKR